MMKRTLLVCALCLCALPPVYGQYYYGYGAQGDNNVSNKVNTDIAQNTNVIGGGSSNSGAESYSVSSGGSASANSGDASAGAYINYAPSSTANYETRIPPLGFVPPYLPMWQHGGWGTTNGYFANGPTTDDRAYERVFNPGDNSDLRMLKRLLRTAPYNDAFAAIAGAFTPALKQHRLRGFEIANAVMRERRPEDKAFMLMIDTDVDRGLLQKAGYAYVGKISVEGKSSRNWDQCYGAIIAEALPWDVDIVLLSGGMKGVTVGQNIAFGGGGGYSQVNYSLSLFGSKATGITEGKGKPVLSGECYRYEPNLGVKRNSPRQFYQMLQTRYAAKAPVAPVAPQAPVAAPAPSLPRAGATPGVTPSQAQTRRYPSVNTSNALMEMAGVQTTPYVDYVASQPITANP